LLTTHITRCGWLLHSHTPTHYLETYRFPRTYPFDLHLPGWAVRLLRLLTRLARLRITYAHWTVGLCRVTYTHGPHTAPTFAAFTRTDLPATFACRVYARTLRLPPYAHYTCPTLHLGFHPVALPVTHLHALPARCGCRFILAPAHLTAVTRALRRDGYLPRCLPRFCGCVTTLRTRCPATLLVTAADVSRLPYTRWLPTPACRLPRFTCRVVPATWTAYIPLPRSAYRTLPPLRTFPAAVGSPHRCCHALLPTRALPPPPHDATPQRRSPREVTYRTFPPRWGPPFTTGSPLPLNGYGTMGRLRCHR